MQQGRALVKRMLLLVLLLDRAAAGHILHQSAPLLFLKDASSKSSAQVRKASAYQRGRLLTEQQLRAPAISVHAPARTPTLQH